MAQAKDCLQNSCQTFLQPATASHGPLALQGCQAVSFGRVTKFPGWGCAGWARAAGVKLTGKQENLGAHAP
eukprot:1146874-Pelagomonas_calceolata.AAC.1